MTTYDIALIGFGGVNRALAELIAKSNPEWESQLGFGLRIVAVSDLKLGSVISPNGIDPKQLLDISFEDGEFAKLSGGRAEADSERVIENCSAFVISEATYTNPIDGEPAVSHCRAALASGKHVVTTNKGPVAFGAKQLKALAAKHGVSFEYEGAVMSGTPVIRMAKNTLAGAEISGFEGILNGTSNFIIGKMEDGLPFFDARAEAQRLGYAEADPTADIEGYDVRLKVVVLANELLGTDLKPMDVSCHGITSLTDGKVREAVDEGFRWKLIGSATRAEDGTVTASVEPRRLPLSHPLAGIGGATNAIAFQSGLLGPVTVTGPGAGRVETAYALLSDIIAIHRESTGDKKHGAE